MRYRFGRKWSPSTELAQVALHIFHTLSNSVPSERSFPIRNLIHDKKRNRLGAQTADKLAYIQVNMRILERGDQDPSWYELPTPGFVEFEEDTQETYNQPSWA
ncbi:hypothetical protein FN846DRAFT_786419 [Sphaerosporella brunnea]|uniref:HAT C-terminal dimerisation domain-containing protein n=1 Tax=Sphaerosporella brunnea TaxID=1250544 RepID=A0A5J5EHF8_9PEZI|nr:hypothetical protein FN846DRAFT_786419 [Sphaerosporella brunnea]